MHAYHPSDPARINFHIVGQSQTLCAPALSWFIMKQPVQANSSAHCVPLQVFVYHHAMSKPLTQRLFASPPTGPQPQDMSQFISAVCWKPQAQLLAAASSQGAIRLMQLTS